MHIRSLLRTTLLHLLCSTCPASQAIEALFTEAEFAKFAEELTDQPSGTAIDTATQEQMTLELQQIQTRLPEGWMQRWNLFEIIRPIITANRLDILQHLVEKKSLCINEPIKKYYGLSSKAAHQRKHYTVSLLLLAIRWREEAIADYLLQQGASINLVSHEMKGPKNALLELCDRMAWGHRAADIARLRSLIQKPPCEVAPGTILVAVCFLDHGNRHEPHKSPDTGAYAVCQSCKACKRSAYYPADQSTDLSPCCVTRRYYSLRSHVTTTWCTLSYIPAPIMPQTNETPDAIHHYLINTLMAQQCFVKKANKEPYTPATHAAYEKTVINGFCRSMLPTLRIEDIAGIIEPYLSLEPNLSTLQLHPTLYYHDQYDDLTCLSKEKFKQWPQNPPPSNDRQPAYDNATT